ncbi:MAG: hypothetical protein AAGA90_10195 [Actinomycetota bacterium]
MAPAPTANELRGRPARSPWRRTLRWLVGVVAVAAVFHVFQASWYERKLNAAVQEVAGRSDVTMNCRMLWEEASDVNHKPGYVVWGDPEAEIRIDICHNAALWSRSPTSDRHRTGLMVVAHELAHLVGHVDESETECVAMWIAPELAVALGGTHEDGVATARWHQSEMNPRLPGEYRAPGCLDGDPPMSPLLP